MSVAWFAGHAAGFFATANRRYTLSRPAASLLYPLHAFTLEIGRAWLVRLVRGVSIGIDLHFEARRKTLTMRIARVRLSRSDNCKYPGAAAPFKASNFGVNPFRLSG